MRRRKSKKGKKILLLSIGIVILIVIILLVIIILNKNVFNYKDKLTIEVGEEVPSIYAFLSSDSKNKDLEIEWDNLEDSDGKIYVPGTYTGSFTYKGKKKVVTLNVRDTTAPTIEGVKDFSMVAYEKEPNFLSGVSATDNSMEKIEVKVEGDYDTEKVGEYKLKYTAKDSSGNEASKDFTLTVKENSNVKVSKTSKGYTLKTMYGITYIDDMIIVNKTYNLPSNYVPDNLVTINGYIKVVSHVAEAFNKLKSDATALGLNIYASSGYRSYSDQNYIYNNYVRIDGKENADTYSARAGFSEHQTGLAIDLNTIDMTFDNTSESNFVRDNCYKYGFVIRYPKGKDNITGYMYEPWHIRYVGEELAKKLYNNGDWITFEEYFGIDSKYK